MTRRVLVLIERQVTRRKPPYRELQGTADLFHFAVFGASETDLLLPFSRRFSVPSIALSFSLRESPGLGQLRSDSLRGSMRDKRTLA